MEYQLLSKFQRIEKDLNDLGYTVHPMKTAFFVMDKANSKMCADVQTVEGLAGFLQAVWYERRVEL